MHDIIWKVEPWEQMWSVCFFYSTQGCLPDKIFFRYGHAGGCVGFVTKSHDIKTLMDCFFPSSLSLPPATAATGFIY